jgi:Transposase
VLREHEAGAKTADLARKHGVSEATLYNWNAKYDGMDVSDAKRLRALEEEKPPVARPFLDLVEVVIIGLGRAVRFAGRSSRWLKVKNPASPAVKREVEEDWDAPGR